MIVKDHLKQDIDSREVEGLVRRLHSEAKFKLKEEIINDPAKRGYAGKQPAQIAKLINQEPCRICVIWTALAYAKNGVDANDVKDAMREVTP